MPHRPAAPASRQTAGPIVEHAARRCAAASRISAPVRFRREGVSSSPSASVHVPSQALLQSSLRPAASSITPQPIDASCVSVKLPQTPATVLTWLLFNGARAFVWPAPPVNAPRIVEGPVLGAKDATVVAAQPVAAEGGGARDGGGGGGGRVASARRESVTSVIRRPLKAVAPWAAKMRLTTRSSATHSGR